MNGDHLLAEPVREKSKPTNRNFSRGVPVGRLFCIRAMGFVGVELSTGKADAPSPRRTGVTKMTDEPKIDNIGIGVEFAECGDEQVLVRRRSHVEQRQSDSTLRSVA
jgi:hypothetical protein